MSALQQRAPSREDFAALLEESFRSAEISEGAVVKGQVVAIEKDMAVIDVGLKIEGRVALKEFVGPGRGDTAVKVGDEVEVYVERIENALGEAVLSRDKARREESWVRLEKAFEKNERVNGVIFNQVKGGFTVDLDGAVAFLPRSQVDIRPVRDVDAADAQAAALPDPQDGPPPRQHRRVAPHRARGEPRRAALRDRARTSKRARSSTASSRTSPSTAPSSTSAASTACCTSPTWRGAASTIRPRSSTSARRSRSRSSGSTRRRTASRSA